MASYAKKAIDWLQKVRQELKEQLEQIDTAIVALGGSVNAKSKKPCCDKNEVIEILTELLRENGSLTMKELDELARDNIVNKRNKSLSMYANLFKKALADPRFAEVAPGTFALATQNRQLQST